MDEAQGPVAVGRVVDDDRGPGRRRARPDRQAIATRVVHERDGQRRLQLRRQVARVVLAQDVAPEVQEGGGDRAELDDRGVCRDCGVIDGQAEQLLGDGQVPGGGDGQELGETLDHTEHDRVEKAEFGHDGSA